MVRSPFQPVRRPERSTNAVFAWAFQPNTSTRTLRTLPLPSTVPSARQAQAKVHVVKHTKTNRDVPFMRLFLMAAEPLASLCLGRSGASRGRRRPDTATRASSSSPLDCQPTSTLLAHFSEHARRARSAWTAHPLAIPHAGSRTRTCTGFLPADFKSAASTFRHPGTTPKSERPVPILGTGRRCTRKSRIAR